MRSLTVCAAFLASLVGPINASGVGDLNKDLKPLLSANAQIYYPGSTGYLNATNRWSAGIEPGLDVIVKVASEADVQYTVEYANAHKVPFLAIGGGHGTSSALNSILGGIGIWMRGMTGLEISSTNQSEAIIQGGVLSGEVIRGLWDKGKMTVTGGCDCTGFTGPMLGGGHGWLQGRYGLITDNLVSARVVLANGTAITASSSENPDLYWGMRGAGHNFGIVTSVHYQVYDRVPGLDSFATASFFFTQDKLESVFKIANQWLAAKDRPVELTHYGIILNNPAIDPKPLVLLLVYWQGDAIPKEYTDPLNALKPVSVTEKVVDLTAANSNTGASLDGPACAHGMSRQTYPVDLYKWDLKNLRAVLNIYAAMPSSLNNSVVLLEGFATNRVLEIPEASTAYPARDTQLLASPLFTYPPNNASLDATVFKIGNQMRNAFLKGTGSQLKAYVNYAQGSESVQAVYGYDSWRLKKLRALKGKYDPQNKFAFFEPIR